MQVFQQATPLGFAWQHHSALGSFCPVGERDCLFPWHLDAPIGILKEHPYVRVTDTDGTT